MAHAKYVQVPGAPQVALGGGLQPSRAPPEENKVFGWVTRLPDAIVPSSWKSGWDNLWAKGNGGENQPRYAMPPGRHVGPPITESIEDTRKRARGRGAIWDQNKKLIAPGGVFHS